MMHEKCDFLVSSCVRASVCVCVQVRVKLTAIFSSKQTFSNAAVTESLALNIYN